MRRYAWLSCFVALASAQAHDDGTRLHVCKKIDKGWHVVGESTTWKAGERFNVLLESERPFKTDYLGFVIHKQGPDGKDEAFVRDWQVAVDHPDKERVWGTDYGLTSLPAGTYSVYAVDWRTRDVPDHFGELGDYLAKVTLTVR